MAQLQTTAFSDGEGIEFGDLNDASRSVMAQIWDALVAQEARLYDDGRPGIIGSARIYSLSAAAGEFVSNGALGITNNPGVIAQWSGANGWVTPGGSDAALRAYQLGLHEINVTLQPGDPVNPRLDIVQIKITWDSANLIWRDFRDAITGALTSLQTYTQRVPKITVQVKQGTPGVNPAPPAIDAGFAPWIMVRVPANFNAAIDPDTQVYDFRWPVRHFGTSLVLAPDMFPGSGGLTLTTAGEWTAAGADTLYVIPRSPRFGESRLIGVQYYGDLANGSTVQLIRRNLDVNPPTDFVSAYVLTRPQGFEQSFAPPSTGGIPDPVWDCGYQYPRISGRSALALKVTMQAGDKFRYARFNFAG